MKIVSLWGGALEGYHWGRWNGESVAPKIDTKVVSDYLGESDKLAELSKDTKDALLLAFAFNDTLSEYDEEDLICLVEGHDFEYVDPQDPKKVFWILSIWKKPKPKKILHIDSSSLFVVETSKPVHTYKIDNHWVLFVKPWCPWVACNFLKWKIFVPKGTVVLLGTNIWEVYEYDLENMNKLLEQVKLELKYKREDPWEKNSPNIPFDYTNLVSKSINVKTIPQRLIYNFISSESVYDVKQEKALIWLDVSRESCVKIDSSTWKKVSLYVDNLYIGSNIVCGSNVTDIYVKSAFFNGKIKCSKDCRLIYFRWVVPSDLTIERGDWDEEVWLKK